MFDATRFPYVFFPVGLNVAGRRCVVIGSDSEALEKAEALAECRADVVRITAAGDALENELAGAFLVISTPQDEALSARLRELSERHRFLFCAIDQPRHGFVAMQAVVRSGPARIAISTGGVSPRVGGILRAKLQAALDETFARFLGCLNAQRERNRTRLGSSDERRAAMRRAARGFDLDVQVRYPKWFDDGRATLGPRLLADAEEGAGDQHG